MAFHRNQYGPCGQEYGAAVAGAVFHSWEAAKPAGQREAEAALRAEARRRMDEVELLPYGSVARLEAYADHLRWRLAEQEAIDAKWSGKEKVDAPV